MAIDIGKKRCGIAVSDPQERVASPVCVLPTQDVVAGAPSWQRVLQDWEPDLLLCGLPLSLDGTQGQQARRIRALAQDVASAAELPLTFVDERLSSAQAKRSLHESGCTEREMRGKVDMIAASLFLQAWLDSKHTHESEVEDAQ